MTDDKAIEYQQVAALTCLDIDLLADIAEDKSMTADQLRDQIVHLKELKDKLISDKADRESRYSAACMIFSLTVLEEPAQ